MGVLEGPITSAVVTAFGGQACNGSATSDWTEVPTADTLWVTAQPVLRPLDLPEAGRMGHASLLIEASVRVTSC